MVDSGGLVNSSALSGMVEVEPLKFGETLTGNADGNAEPSRTFVRACVET